MSEHVNDLESKVLHLQQQSSIGGADNLDTSVTLVMNGSSKPDAGEQPDEEDREEINQSVTLCTIIYN